MRQGNTQGIPLPVVLAKFRVLEQVFEESAAGSQNLGMAIEDRLAVAYQEDDVVATRVVEHFCHVFVEVGVNVKLGSGPFLQFQLQRVAAQRSELLL